jgi:RNA polymerase-associated protein CTR9
LVNTVPKGELIKEPRTKAEFITLSFNLARTLEKLDNFKVAEQIYTSILNKSPNYDDATFRLACINYNLEDMEMAIEYCKRLADRDYPDAPILHGNILLEQEHLSLAQEKFELVLKAHKTDPLALVAMGNVWLTKLFCLNRDRSKDEQTRERALNFFLKALKLNSHNIYAAHGSGNKPYHFNHTSYFRMHSCSTW